MDEKGNTFGERAYNDKYVLTVPAGYAQNYLDACNAYFGDRKEGISGKKIVDAIALTDSKGKIINVLANDNDIKNIEQMYHQ